MARLDRTSRLGFLVGVCSTFSACGPLFAADLGLGRPPRQEEHPAAQQWTLSFTPYSWLAALNGDVTATRAFLLEAQMSHAYRLVVDEAALDARDGRTPQVP